MHRGHGLLAEPRLKVALCFFRLRLQWIQHLCACVQTRMIITDSSDIITTQTCGLGLVTSEPPNFVLLLLRGNGASSTVIIAVIWNTVSTTMGLSFRTHGAPFYTIVQKRCCALGICLFCCLVMSDYQQQVKTTCLWCRTSPVCLPQFSCFIHS